MSDDGRHGLTLIAFIGSVFSPYYAWAGRKDPLDHCAVNVALYGASGKRWTMTERRRGAVERAPGRLAIGPSQLEWDDGVLTIGFDEIAVPRPARVRGTLRLRPTAVTTTAFDLDGRGRHIWRPIAPRAEVEVTLGPAAESWRGVGYFDTNSGVEPLEQAFTDWDWSRAHLTRDTLLFYDVARRGGGDAHLALRVTPEGAFETISPPASLPLRPTLWRMPRHVRGDASDPPTLRETLEDTPFYARSALTARYGGEAAQVVHESLSLDRLRSPLIKAMLPFRMPRTLW